MRLSGYTTGCCSGVSADGAAVLIDTACMRTPVGVVQRMRARSRPSMQQRGSVTS